MNKAPTILEAIDPEITQTLLTRRQAIRKGMTVSTTVAAGLSLASVPVALAALSKNAFAQTPADVTAVLNFALSLEIFENEFYKAVLGTSSSSAQNSAFTPVRSQIPAAAVTAVQQIQKHEAAHVAFLSSNGASNTLNLNADSFDFTGNRGNSPAGPFARATTELAFLLAVAQGAEDTGVRAYKGQAGNLLSNRPVLEAALRIHSVEARHAAKIRRLRRSTGAPGVVKYSGTISGGGSAAAGAGNITPAPPQAVVDAFNAIYGGEETTTQGTVPITSLPNLPSGFDSAAASEAFDEPLTKAQVIAIVQPFFKPTLS
ncbi:MAG: ferritin-like domain-containing protein [Gemmatimonadaceae bacterium]